MDKKESETLEFKKSTSELKEAIISISSILNKHQKGEIYFGINSDGKVIGQSINEKTLRDISQKISSNIEPKIFPKIREEEVEGRKCILVEFQGGNIPYYANGRAYMRVADEDKLISAKELEKIILEKNKDKLRWDTEICEDATLEDISIKRLKWFLKKSGKEYESVESSLNKLGLVKNKKLLNAAIILFGENPQKRFLNAKLRCAVFGTTETSMIIDRQEFEGDLFELIEKAEEYILKNIHIGMKIEGMYRVDIPEIDKDAFREAIINAFCHRNYYDDDSVNIAIFKDRLEIRNPGSLYGGLTIKQIRKEKVSKRRNEIIANLFHDVHFVEKWGRGISLILSEEPTANFKEVAEIFITTFRRKNYFPAPTQKTTQKILSLVLNNSKITRNELAKVLNISADGVKYHLDNLKKDGYLKRVGGRKEGSWKIVKGG
ncbi:putative DNA binding domain-containing protein [Candidatus Pacearchaeota archaeon]|nr:putative DNA binding domain-containing protein [Candidatus Pacearchaeota archaeon]